MKFGLFGNGRLGSAIAEAAHPKPVFVTTRETPPEVEIDVAIDVSVAEALPSRLAYCAARNIPLVIGTTGFSVDDSLHRFAAAHGCLLAPNFSLTVALVERLTRVLGRFADADPTRDPYIIEHHHARKRDAPSGTANLLAKALLETVGRKQRIAIPTVGSPPLEEADLSVSAVRAGSTYSSHDIVLDGPGEVVTLRHEARNVSPYAQGALHAARWLMGRRGLYTMEDVARDVLAPLFQETR